MSQTVRSTGDISGTAGHAVHNSFSIAAVRESSVYRINVRLHCLRRVASARSTHNSASSLQPDPMPPALRHIAGTAQRLPNAARVDTVGQRLLRRKVTEIIKNEIAHESVTV